MPETFVWQTNDVVDGNAGAFHDGVATAHSRHADDVAITLRGRGIPESYGSPGRVSRIRKAAERGLPSGDLGRCGHAAGAVGFALTALFHQDFFAAAEFYLVVDPAPEFGEIADGGEWRTARPTASRRPDPVAIGVWPSQEAAGGLGLPIRSP